MVMDKEQRIKFLQDIVRIKTENSNESEVAYYIRDLLAEHGIKSELIEYEPGRENLVAEIENGEGRVIGLSGHMDVVAAGDPELWDYDPYGADIVDGNMYGRGTADMKAGLCALIIAFIELKETKNFKGKIRLLCTIGEELGSPGSKQLADLGYADDLDALLVAEPFHQTILYAHGGSYNFTVKSIGKAAHSADPKLGHNAIHNLIDGMNRILEEMGEVIEKYDNPTLGRTLCNVTLIEGGEQQNTLPEYAELRGNMRTIPEFDNSKVTQLIENILADLNKKEGYKLELEVTADQPALDSKEDSELIKIIQEHSHEEGVTALARHGTTDACRFFVKNTDMDVAIYGPGDITVVHSPNEHVPVQEYLDFTDSFIKIIEEYLK